MSCYRKQVLESSLLWNISVVNIITRMHLHQERNQLCSCSSQVSGTLYSISYLQGSLRDNLSDTCTARIDWPNLRDFYETGNCHLFYLFCSSSFCIPLGILIVQTGSSRLGDRSSRESLCYQFLAVSSTDMSVWALKKKKKVSSYFSPLSRTHTYSSLHKEYFSLGSHLFNMWLYKHWCQGHSGSRKESWEPDGPKYFISHSCLERNAFKLRPSPVRHFLASNISWSCSCPVHPTFSSSQLSSKTTSQNWVSLGWAFYQLVWRADLVQ